MAEAEIKVDVAVEPSIHKELRDFVQEVADRYGVRIDSADFEWIDVSTSNQAAVQVFGLRMTTRMVQP